MRKLLREAYEADVKKLKQDEQALRVRQRGVSQHEKWVLQREEAASKLEERASRLASNADSIVSEASDGLGILGMGRLGSRSIDQGRLYLKRVLYLFPRQATLHPRPVTSLIFHGSFCHLCYYIILAIVYAP